MTEIERARKLADNLTKIADASRRADGTDIPLGEQCREAASLLAALSQAQPADVERAVEAFLGEKSRWPAINDLYFQTGIRRSDIEKRIRAAALSQSTDPIRETAEKCAEIAK